jgi:hypothetical protein
MKSISWTTCDIRMLFQAPRWAASNQRVWQAERRFQTAKIIILTNELHFKPPLLHEQIFCRRTTFQHKPCTKGYSTIACMPFFRKMTMRSTCPLGEHIVCSTSWNKREHSALAGLLRTGWWDVRIPADVDFLSPTPKRVHNGSRAQTASHSMDTGVLSWG